MKYALSSIRYHKFEYAVIFAVSVLVSFAVVFSGILVSGMERGIDTARVRLGADIAVFPGDFEGSIEDTLYDGVPSDVYLSASYVEELKSIPHVTEVVPRIYLATLEGMSCCDNKTQLIAVDIENDVFLKAWIKSDSLADDEIILGSRFLQKVGDTVTYLGREFTVKEKAEKTGTGFDLSGFVSFDAARQIIQGDLYDGMFEGFKNGDISAVFISSDDPKVVTNIIKSRYGSELSIYVPDKKVSEYTKSVSAVKGAVKLLGILMLAAGGSAIFGMAGVLLRQRRNEAGTLLLIGWSKKEVGLAFLSEIAMVSVTGSFVGIVSSCMMFKAFHTAFENMAGMSIVTDYGYVVTRIIGVIAMVLVISVLSGMSGLLFLFNTPASRLIKEAS